MRNNRMEVKNLSNLSNNEELTILHFLATGLVKMQNQIEKKNLSYPYPKELRIGLDRLAAFGIKSDMYFPRNISEAMNFFNQPINRWGFKEIVNVFNDEESFLEEGILKEICYELSMEDKDVEAELTQQLILQVMNKCRDEKKPEDYVKFRRKISENPYMKIQNIMTWSIDKRNCCAAELFKMAYEEIPLAAIQDGQCYQCSHCGWIVEWRNGIAHCDSPLCREYTDNFRKIISIKEGSKSIYRLKRGLHRYIAKPAIHELALEKKLIKLGVQVELWPNYDAYDLKVVFPDGEVWAVDVKDWSNPYLLAKSITSFSEEPVWDKAYYVVPQYRKKHCSDYKKIFKNNVVKLDKVYMEMEREFLNKVKDKLW